jgi:hypothetical protein
MLRPAEIAIDELLLDPNNPRFVETLRLESEVADEDVESRQADIRKRFKVRGADSDEGDFFSIDDLCASMEKIGFVPIDRVVVRKLRKGNKYLVIEGNRRVCAAKTLLEDNGSRRSDKQLPEELEQSLRSIEVLLLDTDGLSDAEIHDKVGIILGLRHYGSVLEWEPLPKAYNIYREYMNLDPRLETFSQDAKRLGAVASLLSINRSQVKNAIKTYIAYEQLRESVDGVRPRHFSLIEALVTNTRLAGTGYVAVGESDCRLSEPTIERLEKVCEFTRRDNSNHQKILDTPQSVAGFSRLVYEGRAGGGPVKDFAAGLIQQVEDTERTLDDALDNLNTFKRQRRWATALQELLQKQAGELPLDKYTASGNELMYKDELKTAFGKLRRFLLGV